MKRSILLFGALLLFRMAFSQNAFYTETFGSGIPAGWINAGVDKNAQAHTNIWKYTTSGNHSGVGWPTTALHSPTASNGWVIFDSDSLDGGGNGGTPAPQRGYLTTTPINCTGHTNVLLDFYDLYFSFDGNPRVIINNGTTADTINMHSEYDFTFGLTPNPVHNQFDISAYAANQPAVTITLLWDMTQSGYFYWQVDDISLIDAPANDLQISQDGSFFYYQWPLAEVDSFTEFAYTTSVGTSDQTNARVALKVTEIPQGSGIASVVYTDTSALGVTLPYGVDSPLIGSGAYLPLSIGKYTSYISVFADSADGLPYNNADTTSWAVTDSVFAVDNNVYGGSFITYLPAADAVSGTAATQEWANIFFLPVQDTVTSISAAFDAVQSANSFVVQANVYSLPSTYAGYGSTYACTPVIQTEQKLVTQTQMTHANTGGAITVTTVNMRISNATGAADAAVLQPGYYAVSITPVTDSLISLVNGLEGNGVYGAPGGEIVSGSLTPYSNTHFILRMNLGHNFDLLQAFYTRTPNLNPVVVNQSILFRGSTKGTGDVNTTYSWTFQSADSSYSVGANSYSGDTIRYAFPVADSVYVCVTASDNGNSAQYCNWMRVRALGVGINEIAPLSNLNMVPNPTSGRVTINADDVDGAVSVTVIDMLGNVVNSFSDVSNGTFSKSYDLSNLSNGIYIVKIENAGTVVSKKLSISKQ